MLARLQGEKKLPRVFDVMLKTYRDHFGEIRLFPILRRNTALRTGRTALPSMHQCVFNTAIILTSKYSGIPQETGAALPCTQAHLEPMALLP